MPLVTDTDLITAAQLGQVVSFPTDTVPGLAVRPEFAQKLYEVKGRSQHKPLILLGATAEELWPYVSGDSNAREQWQQLTQAHWPGALTLVLPASGKHPRAMTPLDSSSLGIRVPNHPIARKILATTGPLATTSANRSGEATLQSLEAIAQQFPDVAVLNLPNASPQSSSGSQSSPDSPLSSGSQSGQPSTVVAWCEKEWQVLRQGSIALPSPSTPP